MSTDPKKPIPLAPGWNQCRWEQLFDLETLINEVTMINHGSDALGRIVRCIHLAESLRSNLVRKKDRQSLPSFLKELAISKGGDAP